MPVALVLLLAPPLGGELAAAEPSFDCRTAKTARELVTCADAKIAAADRELATAWQSAVAHADAAMAKALRADQKQFLSGLDDGFDSEVWGKAGPPEGKEMRTQVAQLRRQPDGQDALSELERQLRERGAFLRNLRPAQSFAGLWKNNNSELLIVPAGEGRFKVSFGERTFGWPKYHCHFTGEFTASDRGLTAPGAHNTDSEVDEDISGKLLIARAGATLGLSQDIEDNSPDQRRICPRTPALTGPLFHTSLKPADARRLDPD